MQRSHQEKENTCKLTSVFQNFSSLSLHYFRNTNGNRGGQNLRKQISHVIIRIQQHRLLNMSASFQSNEDSLKYVIFKQRRWLHSLPIALKSTIIQTQNQLPGRKKLHKTDPIRQHDMSTHDLNVIPMYTYFSANL